ncbi:VOC family protein [Paenibacillus aestuarii]|uniref:VOC family protein n=1 Tax=Paenibacillus aestuarii TaxID=516965 RepID=A0ABW0K2V3_9BACL|nr:VOC family protein [Paenibacillus aestuarii]
MAVTLIPYLVMEGNAQEAIEFYKKALDAELLFSTTFGEMPANPDFPLPAEAKDLVAHATIKIGNSEIMFSDSFPGQPVNKGNQVTICVSMDDKATAERFFTALQQEGQVNMPLQETHFSPAYGIVTDKFGIPFQIYTESKR